MNFEYCNGETHVIQKGDSLYTISKKHNVPLALILWANPYADIYNLQLGDEICIPRRISPGPIFQGMMPLENELYPENQTMPMREERPEWENDTYPMEGTSPIRNNMQNQRPPVQSPLNDMSSEERSFLNRMPNQNNMPNQNRMPNQNNMDIITIDYVVKEMDSLQSILDNFQIQIEDLVEYNDLNNMMLVPGTTIKIPQENER